jgi:hypothetical protein
MSTPETKPLRIVQLSVDNIKRLKAVRITPEGSVVVIGGDNDQGKSSLIDSIAMALGGGDEIPTLPVRKGEDSAKIVVDLGDIVIQRTFTAAGNTALVVSNKDGARFPSPQAMIDKMTGKLTFDPFMFVRLEGKKRLLALQQLVGLDFKEINLKRESIFAQRTDVNRDLARLKSVAASLPKHDDAPEVEVDPASILEEIKQANAANKKFDDVDAELSTVRTNYTNAKANHESLLKNQIKVMSDYDERIASAERQLAALRTEADRRNKDFTVEADRSTAALKSLEEYGAAIKQRMSAARIDISPLNERLLATSTTNEKVKANRAKQAANVQVVQTQAQADALTAKIEAIDKEKSDLLKSAKFPIEGLSFDETGVLFDGIPFEQASSAAQLRISVAMAAALNPKLGVMLVRDGSLLDTTSLKLLADLAEEKNLQVFVERVSQGAECQVIIEDGEVKSAS